MRARTIDDVCSLYERWGAEHYDEEISQLAHALQTVALARSERASDELVTAALLHDVGHLLELADQRDRRRREGDLRHEQRGARFLSGLFPDSVTRTIALHVSAKRYLCAVEPSYHATLSVGSQRSLARQGGPLKSDEVARFEQLDEWEAAVQLRRWDDGGKVDGLEVEPMDHYRDVLARVSR